MVTELLLARLRETGLPVWDTHVPDDISPDHPYLLVWVEGTIPEVRPLTLDGAGEAHELTFAVATVGLTPASVRGAGARAAHQLRRWEPGPAGGVHWERATHLPHLAQPIRRDKDTPLKDGLPVLWGSDHWRLTGTTTQPTG